jgi:hypothetical protein
MIENYSLLIEFRIFHWPLTREPDVAFYDSNPSQANESHDTFTLAPQDSILTNLTWIQLTILYYYYASEECSRYTSYK